MSNVFWSWRMTASALTEGGGGSAKCISKRSSGGRYQVWPGGGSPRHPDQQRRSSVLASQNHEGDVVAVVKLWEISRSHPRQEVVLLCLVDAVVNPHMAETPTSPLSVHFYFVIDVLYVPQCKWRAATAILHPKKKLTRQLKRCRL